MSVLTLNELWLEYVGDILLRLKVVLEDFM